MKNTILLMSFILSLGILSMLFVNKAEAGSLPSGFDKCLAVCVGDGGTPRQPNTFIIVGEDSDCQGSPPDTIYSIGKQNDPFSRCARGFDFLYIPFIFGP